MITGKKVVKRVREIAKENPDFIYTDQGANDSECSYLGRSMSEPNVGQGCIVGQALLDLGVTREEMVEAEIEGVPGYEVLEYLGIESKFKHNIFLDYVQESQDDGETWKEAVEYADNEVGRVVD